MSDSNTPSIGHKTLSTTFTGLERDFSNSGGEKVWQFRGIKYGSIPARFRQATMNEDFPEISNATAFGPKCPQVVVPTRMEVALIGNPPKYQPQNAPDVFDEFECLNLNITTPPNSHAGNDFPVMVYIHGGGGYSGSNSDWFVDGGAIVSKSLAMGKPILHVAVNYRLAALGHLGSEELIQELGRTNAGNFAYYDMHLALEWIHKHISSFGGSSKEITLYGESFGSLTTEAQLHSLLPARFSRCIMQSQVLGAPIFSEPESIATKSAVFAKVKEHLRVQSVKELQEVPWEDLLAASDASDPRVGLAHVPLLDGEFFDDNWKTTHHFADSKSGSVILGNTAAEGSVVALVLSAMPKPPSPPLTSALVLALQSIISPEKIAPFVNAYSFFDSTSLKEVRANLLKVLEDMMWYSPTQELASRLNHPVYQYTFNHPNPFAGPFHGVPAHALDLVYLHGDPSIFEGLDTKERKLADVMKEHWIKFANGEAVWDEGDMWEFGRNGGMELGVYLMEKKERWAAFEGLAFGEKEGVAGVVMGHLSQMNGVE